MLTAEVTTKRRTLTDRQEEVLLAIYTSIVKRGYPPTIRELCTLLNVRSTNGINDHLVCIRKKGFLEEQEPGVNRSLKLTLRGQRHCASLASAEVIASQALVDVPVFVSIYPGDEEKTDRVLRLSRNLVGPGADFYGYPIFGELIGLPRTGFRDGDVLIVDPSLVEEGRLVLLCDEAVELRRLVWNAAHRMWEFRAVFAEDPPIFMREDEIISTSILGTVVALWRTAG